MNYSFKSLASLLFILAFLSTSHAFKKPTECSHDKLTHEFKFLDVNGADGKNNSERTLISANPSPIRFYNDYSTLKTNSTAYQSYIANKLMPAVTDYWTSTLKVKYPLNKNFTLPNYSSYKNMCGVQVPSKYFTTGVSADIVLFVTAVTDPTVSFVAQAGACMLDTTTNRPILAIITFNLYYITLGTNALDHESNIYTTLHEMTHALGFSSSLYPYYIDANGQVLKNAVTTQQLYGKTATVLNVELLTSKLRAHFGCSNITGALMEDEGGPGTIKSHFERRVFMFEMMTANVIDDQRITQFTLALLEGTGWYVVNYSNADNFYAGAGEGCSYYYGSCVNSAGLPNFAEFCASTDYRRCATSGRGGAICTKDTFSDGCTYAYAMEELDCRNPNASQYAYALASQQKFGPNAGSQCFSGTLNTGRTASSYINYCFTYSCSGSGLSTTLSINIGTTTVQCKAKGKLSVTGYVGTLDCPDPVEYCQTVGKKYCPRGCMGRGQCVSGKCVCKTGYSGADCAANV